MKLHRNIAAIVIVIFGLIILVGLVWFMFLAPAPDPVVEPAPANEQTGEDTAVPTPVQPTPQPVIRRTVPRQTESGESDVRRLAANALERYGTYSNQSGYQNLKDLELFMSAAFLERSRTTLERAQAVGTDTSLYYGITTKAVVAETVSFNRSVGTGTFRIQTQRRESIGSPENTRSFRQEALVDMIKQGGVWKVDAITWQEEP